MKKSEYIPDVSLAVTYVSPRNFDEFVPKNFAVAGVTVNWEVFDWGRKKQSTGGETEDDRAGEQ